MIETANSDFKNNQMKKNLQSMSKIKRDYFNLIHGQNKNPKYVTRVFKENIANDNEKSTTLRLKSILKQKTRV